MLNYQSRFPGSKSIRWLPTEFSHSPFRGRSKEYQDFLETWLSIVTYLFVALPFWGRWTPSIKRGQVFLKVFSLWNNPTCYIIAQRKLFWVAITFYWWQRVASAAWCRGSCNPMIRSSGFKWLFIACCDYLLWFANNFYFLITLIYANFQFRRPNYARPKFIRSCSNQSRIVSGINDHVCCCFMII